MSGSLSLLALLAAMVLWGSSFVAFKYAVMTYDPVVVVFARMAVAGILFLIFLPKWKPDRIRRRDLGLMLVMGLCEPCLYFLLEGQALRLTTASQAGMVAATLPVFVAVVGGLLLGERLKMQAWAGLLLALLGVGMVSVCGTASENAPNPVFGNLLELAAMLCASGYTVSMKVLCSRYSSWFMTAVQSFVGTLFFAPLLLLPSTTLPQTLAVGPTLSVLYLGVVISIGAYGFYNYGVSQLPAWQASAYVNLIPVFALVLGWALLDETLTVLQCAGVAVVFAGVWLTQHRSGRGPVPEMAQSPGLA